MKRKAFITLINSFLFYSISVCQTSIQRNSNGEITNLSQAKVTPVVGQVDFLEIDFSSRIKYNTIKGSPFLKDEWQKAILYSGPYKIAVAPVKINVATHEIYFLKGDEAFVIDKENISKIVFDDSSVFIGHLQGLVLNKKKLDGYFKVMNPGNVQLLKYVNKYVASADSMVGTLKRYYFADNVFYFLKNFDKVERLKKLNKDNIIAALTASNLYAKWIEQNNIDMRKENDVVRFLSYYNSVRQ